MKTTPHTASTQADLPPACALTYGDLVRRLYDLKRLAEPPVPGETSGATTSCDRAARHDAERDLYVDWGANHDGGGCIRREGDEIVAAELEGPGVIWRIWSAQPGKGSIRFFVDGETYPSTFGTGTEDYFGFAWGTPKLFDSATQCQTRNTNNTGHISLVRWHVSDNVPFQSSFEAAIEKYHGNNWPLLDTGENTTTQAAGLAARMNGGSDEGRTGIAELLSEALP
jgi:hypothetical protein